MPFNTEEVAMAIYACQTPVISAVGHETDTTFADFAADLRAPTPSAAAELSAPDVKELYKKLCAYESTLHTLADRKRTNLQAALERAVLRLHTCSPEQKVLRSEQQILHLQNRLDTTMQARLAGYDVKITESVRLLQSLSPFEVLNRGYSMTFKEDTIVSDAKQLATGDQVTIRFAKSSCTAQITAQTGKETGV